MIILLLLMIICYCNKTNFSSSIYKVIRPVLNFFFFFTIRFYKHQKALKSTKRHQKVTTNLTFIDTRFIDSKFIKLKRHLSGKK